MYTSSQEKKASKGKSSWIKRKLAHIITAFMLGFSNAINHEENMVFSKQDSTEHVEKK